MSRPKQAKTCHKISSVNPAPPGGHRAAGIRAARAYARIEQATLAKHLGMSIRDYRRVEAGGKHLDADQRATVADVCGVPAWFVHKGLADVLDEAPAERFAELERQVRANAEAITALRALATTRVLTEAAEAASTEPDVANGASQRQGRRTPSGGDTSR